MRSVSVVFFTFGVTLTCITSSFGDAGSNGTEADPPGRLRLSINDVNDKSSARVPRASATAGQEERMPSVLTSWIDRLKPFVTKLSAHLRARKWLMSFTGTNGVLDRFHLKTAGSEDSFKVAQDFWDRLSDSDMTALMIYFKLANPRKKKFSVPFASAFSKRFGEPEMAEVLVKAYRSGTPFRKSLAIALTNGQFTSWHRTGTSPVDVARQLDPWDGKVLTDRRLLMLLGYILRVDPEKTHHTLAKTFTELYGGDAKLPPIVSGMKMFGFARWAGKTIEREMVEGWIKNGMTVDQVTASLKLGPDQPLTSEANDLLNLFIARDKRVKHGTTDPNSVPKEHFSDGEPPSLILRPPLSEEPDKGTATAHHTGR